MSNHESEYALCLFSKGTLCLLRWALLELVMKEIPFKHIIFLSIVTYPLGIAINIVGKLVFNFGSPLPFEVIYAIPLGLFWSLLYDDEESIGMKKIIIFCAILGGLFYLCSGYLESEFWFSFLKLFLFSMGTCLTLFPFEQTTRVRFVL